MRKYFARIATAVFAFAILAIAAKAQAVDQLVIQVPYEFVVGGKTLPAGMYRVNRINAFNDRELELSNFENRVSVIVVSTEVENTRTEKPAFSFEQIGGQHILSKIETAQHIFEIPVSKSEILLAAAKSRQGSGSGHSGTD